MDKITPQQRSNNMRAIRSKDMKPEMLVRSLVHGIGYRYRVHYPLLTGKPDMVFPGRKKVILVNGCFWHQHKDRNCKIARMPKTNIDYWVPKLTKNSERDRAKLQQLNALGWSALVLWECTLNSDNLPELIRQFLDD